MERTKALAAEQAAVANRAEALKLTGVLAKLSKELDSRSKREEREQRTQHTQREQNLAHPHVSGMTQTALPPAVNCFEDFLAHILNRHS